VYVEEENDQAEEKDRATRPRRRAGRLLILALALAAGRCTSAVEQRLIGRSQAARMLPRFALCPDNQPVRLLIAQACPGGVCGYSCLPDRWQAVPCEK
jgi:hypothetical protein